MHVPKMVAVISHTRNRLRNYRGLYRRPLHLRASKKSNGQPPICPASLFREHRFVGLCPEHRVFLVAGPKYSLVFSSVDDCRNFRNYVFRDCFPGREGGLPSELVALLQHLYEHRIHGMLRKMGIQNDFDIDDLTQDVFIDLLLYGHNYNPEQGNFYYYLLRTVRSAAFRFRQLRRKYFLLVPHNKTDAWWAIHEGYTYPIEDEVMLREFLTYRSDFLSGGGRLKILFYEVFRGLTPYQQSQMLGIKNGLTIKELAVSLGGKKETSLGVVVRETLRTLERQLHLRLLRAGYPPGDIPRIVDVMLLDYHRNVDRAPTYGDWDL